MAGEFDREEFRPDDLEVERLCDSDPQLRRLWVERCQAERDARRLSAPVEFRASGQDYGSDAPVVPTTTEARQVADRLARARQQLKEYCDKKGLPDLSEEPC